MWQQLFVLLVIAAFSAFGLAVLRSSVWSRAARPAARPQVVTPAVRPADAGRRQG